MIHLDNFLLRQVHDLEGSIIADRVEVASINLRQPRVVGNYSVGRDAAVIQPYWFSTMTQFNSAGQMYNGTSSSMTTATASDQPAVLIKPINRMKLPVRFGFDHVGGSSFILEFYVGDRLFARRSTTTSPNRGYKEFLLMYQPLTHEVGVHNWISVKPLSGSTSSPIIALVGKNALLEVGY